MKKLYTLLAVVLITASSFAQAPEKMSYQAVIRDSGDALVANQAVGMQISILQGSASGTAVYTETQIPTSNVNGLVTLEIGTGTTTDDFSTIDWATGPYFIKTETDPTGGTTYTITGTSQLLSVPYALYAKQAQSVDGDNDTDPTNEIELPAEDGTEGQILTTDGEGNVSWQTPSVSVESCSLSIGDTYAGGIIFYLDSSGCHGLVCAPTDQAINVPASVVSQFPYLLHNGIGMGFINTEYLVGIRGAGNYAAKICYDLSLGGFDDWYLPSKYELDLMKLNIGGAAPAPNTNIGNFSELEFEPGLYAGRYYWSSTSYDFEYIERGEFWTNQLTGSIFYFNVNKWDDTNGTAVRAVRAF